MALGYSARMCAQAAAGRPLFKVALPSSFKVSSHGKMLVAEGPDDRSVQLGALAWQPGPTGIARLLVRSMGPERFLEALKKPALAMLEARTNPGSLELLEQESTILAGRPACLIVARGMVGDRRLTFHGYYTFSRRGEPVAVVFIAPGDDGMEWTLPLLEGIVLLS